MPVTIDSLASDEPPGQTDPTALDGARRSVRRGSRSGGSTESELRDRVYSFDDLSGYRTSDRWFIRTAGLVFYLLIRLISSTLRWEVRGREHLDSILTQGHQPIFTFWHVCILSATW